MRSTKSYRGECTGDPEQNFSQLNFCPLPCYLAGRTKVIRMICSFFRVYLCFLSNNTQIFIILWTQNYLQTIIVLPDMC